MTRTATARVEMQADQRSPGHFFGVSLQLGEKFAEVVTGS